ncbi:Protein DCL homolog, chloroplastic [Linum grandiflorum]
MAAALRILRGIPLLRLQHHRLATATLPLLQRTLCSTPSEATSLDNDAAAAEKSNAPLINHGLSNSSSLHDPDYRKWREIEDKILSDIEPTVCLAQEILHSNRYDDGSMLETQDEIAVMEKLLAHHPNSEDKIGCGLGSIAVDRHPEFKQSRCLFVVRTDGTWIDFSYKKCLRGYIRDKYPTDSQRFLRVYYKSSTCSQRE